MWTQDQIDRAKFIVFHDYESKQPLNMGTMEIDGANNGVYLMHPVPPFGGLVGENNVVGGKIMGVHVPIKQHDIAFTPKSIPVADRPVADQFAVHQFSNGSI